MSRNLIRLIFGGLLAIPVAGGLFFIMQQLIATADPEIDAEKSRKIADIHMPEKEIEVNRKEKPEKVEDPEEPPPDLETPDVDINPETQVVNVAPQARVDVSIDGSGVGTGDGEYLPIVKVAPVYPRRAQTRGIAGYVLLEFTVTKTGAVENPVVIEAKPPGIFDRAAINAALKFKYKPKVVNGEAIDVGGVRNRITFELAD